MKAIKADSISYKNGPLQIWKISNDITLYCDPNGWWLAVWVASDGVIYPSISKADARKMLAGLFSFRERNGRGTR